MTARDGNAVTKTNPAFDALSFVITAYRNNFSMVLIGRNNLLGGSNRGMKS